MHEGDTAVVHSMDRLARNLDDLRRLVQQLAARPFGQHQRHRLGVAVADEAAHADGHASRIDAAALAALVTRSCSRGT